MVNLTHATKSQKNSDIKRSWHLVDMKGKTLGRVTTMIASLLQGKQKPRYVSYLDCGDYVVVINARQVRLTGKKAQVKTYTNFSGYPAGLRITSFATMMEKKPGDVVRRAVSGMLPKNKHRQPRLNRLFVFVDDKHPYQKELKQDG